MPKYLLLLWSACFNLLFSCFAIAQGVDLSFQKGIAAHEIFAAFSPDGRYMIGTSYDGNLSVYDIKKGVLQSSFNIAAGGGSIVKFLPDGKHIAVKDDIGYEWKIVKLLSGEIVDIFTYPVQALSPDIPVLAYVEKIPWQDSIAALQGIIFMQEHVKKGNITYTDTAELNKLMSYDQQKIDQELQRFQAALKTYPEGAVHLIDPVSKIPLGVIETGINKINAIALDGMGKKLAVFGTNNIGLTEGVGLLRIIDISTSEILFEKTTTHASAFVFSPTGQYLMYNNGMGFVMINIKSGAELFQFMPLQGFSERKQFTKDERYFLNLTEGSTISLLPNSFPTYKAELYDLHLGKLIREFKLGAYSFTIDPDFGELAYWNYTPEYPRKIERRIYCIDLNTGKEKKLPVVGDFSSQGLIYSPDGKHLLFARDGKLVYWDRRQGREIKKIDSPQLQIYFSSYNIKQNEIVLSTNHGVWSLQIDKEPVIKRLPLDSAYQCLKTEQGDKLVYSSFLPNSRYALNVYSLAEAKKLQYTEIDSGKMVMGLSISPSGRHLATTLYQWQGDISGSLEASNSLSIRSVSNGKIIGDIPLPLGDMSTQIIWDKDDLHFYLISEYLPGPCKGTAYREIKLQKMEAETQPKYSVKKVNITTGKYAACYGELQYASNFKASNSGKYIAVIEDDLISQTGRVIHLLNRDLKLQSKIVLPRVDELPVNTFFFNEKEDSIIVLFSVSNAERILVKTYAIRDGLSGSEFEISGVDFVYENLVNAIDRFLVIGKMDGEINIVDLYHKKLLYRLTLTGANDYLLATPDNYYLATKNAVNAVRFNKNDISYPFRQFDLIYNRPDIVLSQMSDADPALIESYRRAYEKRVKKMGFRQDQLSADARLPEIQIVNSTLPYETDQPTLTLELKAMDKQHLLDRINLWVNDVPLFGINGIDVKHKKLNEIVHKVAIPLSFGNNKIEVSCYNEKGLESLLEEIEISYTAPVAKPNLFLAVLGASKYAQAEMNLQYAAKDAADVADLFEKKQSGYAAIQIKKYTDQEITRDKLPEIRRWLEQSGVNDQVIVFFAGHGLISDSLDYYLATYDTDFARPGARGISYEALESLLDGIPARNKLILLDACHSGEIDKESVAVSRENKTTSGNVTFRSFNTNLTTTQVGLENSFELMKSLFVDLRRSSGATAIASAGAAEYAVEGSAWQNGVFTYCLINGLSEKEADINKDGAILLSELQLFLSQKVPELTQGQQRPAFRLENIANDWRVW